MVDYLAALELLMMPFVLNLGASAPLAKWLAIATGLAVILISLLTDYKLGVVRILPSGSTWGSIPQLPRLSWLFRSCSVSPASTPGSIG